MVTSWGRRCSHCRLVLAFSWKGSKSLAHCPLCGRHTSIVVHKDEFFFGSGGISSCTPVSDFPWPVDWGWEVPIPWEVWLLECTSGLWQFLILAFKPGVVVHYTCLNPSTWEATDESVCWRLAWSIQNVPKQPGLHSERHFLKKKFLKRWKKRKRLKL